MALAPGGVDLPVEDPLAWDIAAVLQRMGGSAHQNVVIDCVAALHRSRGHEVKKPDLARMVLDAFERYRELFFRPFGEGSLRWALSPEFA